MQKDSITRRTTAKFTQNSDQQSLAFHRRELINAHNDTSTITRHLISGPVYRGSEQWQQAYVGCSSCCRPKPVAGFVSWGNTAGPVAAFALCKRCVRKRLRMPHSDRLLFDQAARQNCVNEIAAAICREGQR